MRGAFQSMCKYMHVEVFFWACVIVCVCARARAQVSVLLCVCVPGQDQWSKSTLERVAQSSSPTQLSLLSLPSRQCSPAPSSWRVEEFTELGSKRAVLRAKWSRCETINPSVPSSNLNEEQSLTGALHICQYLLC